MAVSDLVAVGSGLATIAAAAVVSFQLVLLKRQQTDEFLSSFNQRYDQIVQGIPLSVLIGDADPTSSLGIFNGATNLNETVERAIFDYMQLCEEQLTLLTHRKILLLDSENPQEAKRSIVSLHTGLQSPKRIGLWLSNREQWEQAADEWIDGMRHNFSNPLMEDCFDKLKERLAKRSHEPFQYLSKLIDAVDSEVAQAKSSRST
jgi:hypothetical protein